MVIVAGAAFLAGRGIHKAVHSRDSNDNKLAGDSYSMIRRRVLMAMLVHWCYFRDLNPAEEALAWLLEYDNKRAKNYGEECWEPHPCNEKYRGELEELGLAFLRRKSTHSNDNAPDLVIVLRGTILTRLADLVADLKIATQRFGDQTDRVVRILELVLEVVKANPGKQICMAGHSLGAATALIVGGCLFASADNINIDTHLFNPPLLTLVDVARGLPAATPPDDTCRLELNFQKLKEWLVGNKVAVNKEWEQFGRLQDWVPHIYLNPGDPICRQYIRFYRTVKHPGDVISPQGLLSGLFSENVTYLKNVVPSAHLCISTWRAKPKWHAKLAPGLIKEVIVGRLPHSLRQWHKYTDEYINLREHEARLLQQPHSFEPTVSPRIPDYSKLSE